MSSTIVSRKGTTSLDEGYLVQSATRQAVGISVAIWALGALFFFRAFWLSGFDLVFGDNGDAQLLIAVLEHWHRFFSGTSGFNEALFFHPEPSVLGYTDTYFLFGLPYTAFRWMSVDPYASYILSLLVLSGFGFAGYQLLLFRHLGVRWWIAALAALIAVFGNAVQLRILHGQTFTFTLLPWVLLLTLEGLRARRQAYAAAWAAAAGILLALVFLTAFVTAWFFVLVLLFMTAFLALTRAGRELMLRSTGNVVAVLTAGGISFAIGMMPFLAIYGPVIAQQRGRTFDEVLHYAPVWSDFLNVGANNLVWGRILGAFEKSSYLQIEVCMGYAPALLLLSLLAIGWLFVSRDIGDDRMRDRLTVLKAAAISLIVISMALMDFGGFRPWYLIWKLIPGAEAVRTIFRYQIVLMPFAIAIVAFAIDRCVTASRAFAGRRSIAGAALAVLGIFLIAEQITVATATALSRKAELAKFGVMPEPPAACRVFYAAEAARTQRFWVHFQTEAVMLAQLTGVPTVNGNSSWQPDGWDFNDPSMPDYRQLVRKWLQSHGLNDGVCEVVVADWSWTLQPSDH